VGTVTLTAAAPAGGAVIQLASSEKDVARVTAETITIAAGATSGTFNIDAATIHTTQTTAIDATYAGVRKSATLTVRPPTLVARFTVNSTAEGADKCKITSSDGTLDCTMDATSSEGFITRYDWTYTVAGRSVQDSGIDKTRTPDTDCGIYNDVSSKDTLETVSMTIQLIVASSDGTKSSAASKSVTVVASSRCGFK